MKHVNLPLECPSQAESDNHPEKRDKTSDRYQVPIHFWVYRGIGVGGLSIHLHSAWESNLGSLGACIMEHCVTNSAGDEATSPSDTWYLHSLLGSNRHGFNKSVSRSDMKSNPPILFWPESDTQCTKGHHDYDDSVSHYFNDTSIGYRKLANR